MNDAAPRSTFTTVRIDNGPLGLLDLDTLHRLLADLRKVDQPLVLSGGERAFSAGVDLARMLSEDAAYTENFVRTLDELVETLYTLPVPTVAAVAGHAIGGGALLIAACDVKIMGAGRLSFPEMRVGVPIPPASREIYRSRVGSRASYLLQTSISMDAAYAQQVGLIDETVNDNAEVSTAASRRIHELAEIPALLYQSEKTRLNRSTLQLIEKSKKLDLDDTVTAWTSPEAREHIQEYVDQISNRRH